MSDILIRGMEMPKDGCKSCGFDVFGQCLIKANMDKPYEVTHSCPLIELPEHGRLIDADALAADMSFYDGGDWHYGYSMKTIKAAPTIIPVSGGVE